MSEQLLTTRNRLAKATRHDKRSKVIQGATPVARLLLGPSQVVPLFAIDPIAAKLNSKFDNMKNDNEPRTLDSARELIASLRKDLSQAQAKTPNNVSDLPSNDVPTDEKNVSLPADARKTSSAAALTPAITEASVQKALETETNFTKRCSLFRTLAQLQTARAVDNVRQLISSAVNQ